MKANRPIMLVGGSGLGPWAWERVTPILGDRGFQILTPQLRTSGAASATGSPVVLDDWVEDISAALTDRGDVTLVAHSFAGYVAAALLERRPHNIRQLIFIDGVLPQPGKSWFDAMGPDVASFMMSLAQDGTIPWFSREQLDQLYPGHGITDADFAWMQCHLTPQPIGTYTQAAIEKPLSATTARLTYLRCMNTNPPAADLSADRSSWEYRTLDAGHWPMITHPADTARVIIDFASQ